MRQEQVVKLDRIDLKVVLAMAYHRHFIGIERPPRFLAAFSSGRERPARTQGVLLEMGGMETSSYATRAPSRASTSPPSGTIQTSRSCSLRGISPVDET